MRDSPYMAKSDANGRFTIKNLPTGEHTFQLWHERVGYLRNIELNSHATSDRGRLTVTIKEGANQLGVGKLAPVLFAEE